MKVGDAMFDFKSSAACVVEEVGAVKVPVTLRFPVIARSEARFKELLLMFVFQSRLSCSTQPSVETVPSSSKRCTLSFASVVETNRCLFPRLVQTFPASVVTMVFCFVASKLVTAVVVGLLASEVLSTFPRLTIALLRPPTVPENVGFSNGAFAASKSTTA